VLRNGSGALLNSHGYAYDLANERTNQTRVDGSYVNYLYDSIGQITNASGFESGGTVRLNEQFGYSYDAAHNLSIRVDNTLVQTFNVNSLNDLTTVTRNATNALTVIGTTSSSATSVTINDGTTYKGAYLYDDATFASTNGFTPVDGNNIYSATARDSLGRTTTGTVSAYLPASASYTYDKNGNLLNDGKRFFEYDEENQLTAVTVSNAWRSEFTYDGKSRRRTRKEFTWQASVWSQTNIVYYVYAGNLVIQERDANNQPLVTYTRGIDLSRTLQKAGGIGGLLARSDNATQRTAFYHADGNGNITALINAQQTLVAKYLYDPFGNILSKSGPLADSNLYCFSSKEYHPNSGLIYYLYRCYEPKLQRWLNRDPIGEVGGFNLSCFIQNRPLMKVDVWGLEQVDYGTFGGTDSSVTYPPNWQGPTVPSQGNCWRYACNDPTDDFAYHNTNPPGWAADPTCKGLEKGVRDAGAIDPVCDKCQPGYHKIKLQFSEDADKGKVPEDWPKTRDFHFIKQLPDGRWAGKNASGIPEIVDPNALLPNYTKCGDTLCIPDHVDTQKLSK
jgi:RHS repeat-associated protein